MRHKVVAVIVNFASADHVGACLASLKGEADSVVVVDNFSTPEQRVALERALREHAGWAEQVDLESNVGFGAGVNRGLDAVLARSRGDEDEIFVWVLNPDTTVTAGAAQALADVIAGGRADMVSPVIYTGLESSRSVWFSGGTFDRVKYRSQHDFGPVGDREEIWSTEFMTGAAPMARLSTWIQLDGFRADFFLYWEDLDLSLRARQRGLRLSVVRDANIWHHVGGSGNAPEGRSDVYYYFMQRNRVRIAREFGSVAHLIRPGAIEETLRLCLRPLRENVAPLKKAMASLKGLADGLFGGPPSYGAKQYEVARYYKTLRSAHLERDSAGSALTIYTELNYDLDAAFVSQRDNVRKANVFQLSRLLLAHGVRTLELNEPAMVRAWPQLVSVLISTWGLRRRGLRVVAYCIENLPVRSQIEAVARGRFSFLAPIGDRLVTVLASQYSRLAFGTEGALRHYARYGVFASSRVRLFTSLPAPRSDVGDRRDVDAVFVGALDDRKGIAQLMGAWDVLSRRLPALRLEILGKGPLLESVKDWAGQYPGVRLRESPSRAEIADAHSRARVAILLSQPVPGWREQVGLPIIEALAAGCTVVTTTESGIAEELAALGHHTIAPDSTAEHTAEIIEKAVTAPLQVEDVLSSLPSSDGRVVAQRWLTGAGGGE
ncbi:glycosyltransferase [Microbacterium sp. JC 701]|uniref:glycosyltransferase n=1 Tax=Microbacterium sp. JC 701 TaxID=2897389 RepID=UPI001E3A5771|nr:glycosyltransferase [Microbacterium sp. JC 701]MCD2170211.1 glycosyltransferase [Microbacterium sp. JC 701]